jgi:hypothetical protein
LGRLIAEPIPRARKAQHTRDVGGPGARRAIRTEGVAGAGRERF